MENKIIMVQLRDNRKLFFKYSIFELQRKIECKHVLDSVKVNGQNEVLSTRKVFVNMDNVLYISEINHYTENPES